MNKKVSSESLVQDIRRKTRKKYSSEEKIRIVLEAWKLTTSKTAMDVKDTLDEAASETGVGKIYQQTAIDTHSNVGFAKIYSDKTALTAADILNDKILPFFDSQNMNLLRILTDRGTEYCERVEPHPHQLFLHPTSPDSCTAF